MRRRAVLAIALAAAAAGVGVFLASDVTSHRSDVDFAPGDASAPAVPDPGAAPGPIAPAIEAREAAIADGVFPAIDGTVVDLQGGAIAGAEVDAVACGESGNEDATQIATTDEAGRFRIACVDASARTLLFAANAFAPQRREGVLPGARLTVVLAAGCALRVVVRDADDGRPLAGASVRAMQWNGPLDCAARTDARGEARTSASSGFVELDVRLDGYLPGSLAVALRAGAESSIEMTLARDAHATQDVWLRVVAAEDGKPIAGAKTYPGAAETFADGLLRTRAGIDSYGGRVRVEAPDRATTWIEFTRPAGDAPENPIIASLLATGRLRGRLVDEHHAPIAAADVRALMLDRVVEAKTWSMAWYEIAATSGADGRFVLDGLIARASYELQFDGADFTPFARAGFTVAAGETLDAGDVVCAPGSSVAGAITDDEGRPLAGVRVVTSRRAGDPHRFATSGADGRFRLAHVEDGECAAFRCDGFVPELRFVSELRNDGTVRLRRGLAIDGIVRLDGGAPATGARVICTSLVEVVWAKEACFPHIRERETSAGADGRFRFDDLPPGECELRARHGSSGMPASAPYLRVASGASNVEIALQPPAVIAGIVRSARDGRPVSSFEWQCTSADGSGRNRSSYDGGGRFRLSVSPGVGQTLEVCAPDHGFCTRGPLVLEAGELREVEFLLPPADVVEGEVHWPDGSPARGLQIEHACATLRPREVATDAAGRFRLEGTFPEQPVPLRARWRYGETELQTNVELTPAAIEVAAAREGVVRLVAARPGTLLDGHVDLELAQGIEWSGGRVQFFDRAHPAAPASVQCAIDPMGRFRVILSPGTYDLRLELDVVRDTLSNPQVVVPTPAWIEIGEAERAGVSLKARVDG